MEDKIQEIYKCTEYCLNCKTKPCQKACPLGNDIPQFIKYTKQGEYKKAYEVLKSTTIMPYICGRICPKSEQCQGSCVRGVKGEPVQIGKIEAFLGDMALLNGWNNENIETKSGKKVAIIGAGPTGLTVAVQLARKGHEVSIFEKRKEIGGILTHGIPEFRLENRLVENIEEQIANLGIKVYTGVEIGKSKYEEIRKEYDAIFFAVGANITRKKPVEGIENEHVLGAYELLEDGNHPDYNGKEVIVLRWGKCGN